MGLFEGNNLLSRRRYHGSGCRAASVHSPKTSLQQSCSPFAFFSLQSPFCRSFKEIHSRHSNCQLRGTCGFLQHTWGPGALKQGCGAQHPNKSWNTACSHPPEPCRLASPAGGMHSAGMLSPFGCQCGQDLGAQMQVLTVNALYAPNPCPRAVAILPRSAVLGEAGNSLLMGLASAGEDAGAS